MIVAIHQPQYFPWLGYFDKIRRADVFCFLDNVQYKKNEWQNRNQIKTAQGRQWLTVPVTYRFPQKINEVKINTSVRWRKKHFQTLITNYSKAPFFQEYIGFFEELYSIDWRSIADLNIDVIKKICGVLDLNNRSFVIASEMFLSEDPTERLIDICKSVGGDTYLSGQDGAKYMDLERFREKGIQVVFQEFKCPAYPQLFGEFQPNLSIVDLLFNCGSESIEKIRECNPATN